MSVHAFCETVFALIWETVPVKRAAEVVGEILEVAIAKACEGKAEVVLHQQRYGPKRARQEMDVATRSGVSVTLIETKAKTMTTDAQYGTSGQFYEDYARSFLPMAKQLARHDSNLRAGATPLATAEEADDLTVERIAVSPVSFGPIGDRVATAALMAALPGVSIRPLREDERASKATDAFNDAMSKLMEELALALPEDKNGNRDLVPFFMSTHWLDLGQLLVALDRVGRVEDALRPIRRVSTGSRDFWTDFAWFS